MGANDVVSWAVGLTSTWFTRKRPAGWSREINQSRCTRPSLWIREERTDPLLSPAKRIANPTDEVNFSQGPLGSEQGAAVLGSWHASGGTKRDDWI